MARKKKPIVSGPTLDELGDAIDCAVDKPPTSKKYRDIPMPASLSAPSKGVTPKTLGAYRAKLHAFFAPHLLGEMYQSLRKAVVAGDMQALDKTMKAYGILSDGKQGINISLNQQNDNRQLAVGETPRPKELGSADAIYRQLAVEREQRRLGPASIVDAEATPVDEG